MNQGELSLKVHKKERSGGIFRMNGLYLALSDIRYSIFILCLHLKCINHNQDCQVKNKHVLFTQFAATGY